MALIQLQQFCYSFPDGNPLFSDLQLTHHSGRLGLLGNNGSGKSTLLQLIHRAHHHPLPGLHLRGTTAHLTQQRWPQADAPISKVLGVQQQLEALERAARGEASPEDIVTIGPDWDLEARLQRQLEKWQLDRLGLQTPVGQLSGGEQTRLALLKALLHAPDILLLDEPDNHLDRSGRRALTEWLAETSQCVVIASHDRETLAHVDRIYALESGQGTLWGGNIDTYIEWKEAERARAAEALQQAHAALTKARRDAHQTQNRREKHQVRGRKQKIKSGLGKSEINTLKNASERVQGKASQQSSQRLGRLEEVRQQRQQALGYRRAWRINLEMEAAAAGKVVLEGTGLQYAYGPGTGPLWAEPLKFTWRGQDRIHVRGPNGSGKTTLLRLLTGDLSPRQGQIRRNYEYVATLDQQLGWLDRNESVRANFRAHFSRIPAEHDLRIRLDHFQLGAEYWDRPVNQLSGGEGMRLALACLLATDRTPDLLLLDEPTNHLDFQSREIFSEFLTQYPGPLVLVTHDSQLPESLGITGHIELLPARK